jgi:mono/diheme cytochrome c family protein
MLNRSRVETVVLFALLLTTTLLLPACDPPVGSAENGQRWFDMHNCSGCHGKNANDGRAPKIAALDRSFGSFVRFIRNPDSVRMPNFPEERVSKQDAADIYTWLKGLPE